MKQMSSPGSNFLVFRQPFPWIWIVAIPGLAFGLMATYFAVLSPFGILADVLRDNGVMRYVGIGIIAVIGLSLLSYTSRYFCRVGCTVDKARRRIVREWGVIVPVIPTIVAVEDDHALAISGIVRSYSTGGSESEYYCDLVHPKKSRVRIGMADSKQAIENMAIAIADAVCVNVYDATYEPPQFVHAGAIAKVRDILARADNPTPNCDEIAQE